MKHVIVVGSAPTAYRNKCCSQKKKKTKRKVEFPNMYKEKTVFERLTDRENEGENFFPPAGSHPKGQSRCICAKPKSGPNSWSPI